MLDDKDIENLIRAMELKFPMRGEFEVNQKAIREDIDGLREMIQMLVTSIDKLVGAVSDLNQEYAMSAN